jgi:hypothetical protein
MGVNFRFRSYNFGVLSGVVSKDADQNLSSPSAILAIWQHFEIRIFGESVPKMTYPSWTLFNEQAKAFSGTNWISAFIYLFLGQIVPSQHHRSCFLSQNYVCEREINVTWCACVRSVCACLCVMRVWVIVVWCRHVGVGVWASVIFWILSYNVLRVSFVAFYIWKITY